METIKTLCNGARYNAIHESVHKARKGTKNVKVNKEALEQLLIDHCRLADKLGELGVKIDEGGRHE